MGVRSGYKQTEVGVIPEDWDAASLGFICSMKSGQTITSAQINEVAEFPCYGGNGLRGFTSEYTHEGHHVLIGRQGALCGNILRVEGRFFASEHAIVVSLLEQINVGWLGYALEDLRLNQYSESSAQPGLSVAKISELIIAAPPTFAEQHSISEALSDADAYIQSLERLIAKKRDLKQAAMQTLLTGQTRLPGFSGEWEMKRLGEVGRFQKGSGVRRDQAQSGSLPCVRYGEIYTLHHDVIRSFASHISPEIAAEATRLYRGDLLFAGSGETKEEIGKCVALADDVEAYAGGDIVILRPRFGDPVFLGYVMNMPKITRQKASFGQGDAVVHISATALASVEVAIPEPPEQTAIAAVLSDIDAEIEALEVQIGKTRLLKQAMMQELLTGRTRLPMPKETERELAHA